MGNSLTKIGNEMKLKSFALSALFALPFFTTTAHAVEVTVKIQNLTHGIHFTPFLVAAHDDTTRLFQTGTNASANLQAMAEGGNISGLSSDIQAASGLVVENPAGGLLAPGASTTTSVINTDGTNNNYLSIVAMLLPTNDGFAGLDSWKIPSEPGTYVVNINAYDAGTEANDEIVNGGGAPNTPGIPAAPGGNAGTNGTGVTTTEINTYVHIHRGALGDDDATGGKSDLDNTIHRWLNPVVRATITVSE